MITTWSQFLNRLLVLIDGDDPGSSSVPVNTLEAIISMGERRLYRELRSRFNEKSFSAVTTTSNAATIPSDFEASSVVHFGKKPIGPVSEEFLREYLNSNPTGDVRYFAAAGPSFMFGPAVADGTAVQGRYFYRLPALSAATLPTNALFAVAEDLFTYAALCESAPFFEQDARIPLWNAKYESIRDSLNRGTHSAAYSAGRMRVRPSTPILR